MKDAELRQGQAFSVFYLIPPFDSTDRPEDTKYRLPSTRGGEREKERTT